jgi:hypothetical protein
MNINKGLIGAAAQQEVRLPIKVKYCLYARKSSESEERQIMSIDSQLKEMSQLAEKEKLEIVDIKQESHSAKATGQRPIFNEMVEGIESGKFNPSDIDIKTYAKHLLTEGGDSEKRKFL